MWTVAEEKKGRSLSNTVFLGDKNTDFKDAKEESE